MRLHADQPWARYADVFLDGEKVDLVEYADDGARFDPASVPRGIRNLLADHSLGFVVHVAKGADGAPILDRDAHMAVRTLSRGRVEIRMKADAPQWATDESAQAALRSIEPFLPAEPLAMMQLAQLDPKLPLVICGDLTPAESKRIYEAWSKVSPDGLVIFARDRDEIQNLNVVDDGDIAETLIAALPGEVVGRMPLRLAAALRKQFLVWSRPVTVVANHAPCHLRKLVIHDAAPACREFATPSPREEV